MSHPKPLFASSAFASAIAGLSLDSFGKNVGTALSSLDKIATPTDQAVAVLMTQAIAKSFVPVDERKTVIAGMEHVKTLVHRAGLSGYSDAVNAINKSIIDVQAQQRHAPIAGDGHDTTHSVPRTAGAGDRQPGQRTS